MHVTSRCISRCQIYSKRYLRPIVQMNKIQLVENNLEGEFQRLNAVDDSKARLMGTI